MRDAMSIVNSEKIAQMLERFSALETEMASGAEGEAYVKLATFEGKSVTDFTPLV